LNRREFIFSATGLAGATLLPRLSIPGDAATYALAEVLPQQIAAPTNNSVRPFRLAIPRAQLVDPFKIDEVIRGKPTAAVDVKWGGSVIDGKTFAALVYAEV
jgi:hypothetical protein